MSGSVPKRALRAQVIVDETTAMAHAQPTLAAKRRAFDLTALCLFTAWNLGTLAGALAGSGLGNPRDYGLDAVFPAVFLALLAPQLRGRQAIRAAVAGALIALALVPIAPAGVPIIAAALAAVPILLARVAGGRGRGRTGARGWSMSWWPVLALCASAYALKALGLVLGDRLGREASARWSLEIVVVPVLAALIVIQTFSTGQRFVLDARTPALLVAAVLVWRKAPFVVVALSAAAATAALLRLVA